MNASVCLRFSVFANGRQFVPNERNRHQRMCTPADFVWNWLVRHIELCQAGYRLQQDPHIERSNRPDILGGTITIESLHNKWPVG